MNDTMETLGTLIGLALGLTIVVAALALRFANWVIAGACLIWTVSYLFAPAPWLDGGTLFEAAVVLFIFDLGAVFFYAIFTE